jgi:predicted aconitase
MRHLQLSTDDQALLDGKQGKAMQFAMKTIVIAANIDKAESLIDISFAQIDACFYSGRAHLDFVNCLLENEASLFVQKY